ncbi:MAG: PHP domain-containing protein, partial [Candidatus Omnitrophota bacterium]
MSADLHVHTLYSDGTFTPEEVVREAVRIGLEAVAITDHDCIDGISPAMKAAENTRLEIIPGIEISAVAADTEIHILGYFIDWHDPVLVEILRKMKANRVERMRKMVKLLNKAGFNIDPEQVIKSVPEGTIGRLHLARLMCEKGFVRGTQEAFDRYIGDGKPCSVRHERLDYDRAIKMILD